MPSWRELPLVKPVLEERLQELSASFLEYVDVFIQHSPFSESQLRAHLKALEARGAFPSAAEAVKSSDFADAVRDVLQLWVGTRGGIEVVPVNAFRSELGKLATNLAGLEQLQIDDVVLDGRKVALRLWDLINSMCLVTKKGKPVTNKLVSGSKALHHVLPKLVIPIDREYTQTFFGWHNSEFQYNPRDCFNLIFLSLADLAKQIKPARLVGEGWMSNPPKILDNAMIGYCVKHGLKSENTQYQQKQRAAYQAMKKRARELGIWEAIEAEAAKNANAVLIHRKKHQ
jgi:hypothetical protein